MSFSGTGRFSQSPTQLLGLKDAVMSRQRESEGLRDALQQGYAIEKQKEEEEKRRKQANQGMLGSVLGAVGGALLGGPLGIGVMAGAGAGSQIGAGVMTGNAQPVVSGIMSGAGAKFQQDQLSSNQAAQDRNFKLSLLESDAGQVPEGTPGSMAFNIDNKKTFFKGAGVSPPETTTNEELIKGQFIPAKEGDLGSYLLNLQGGTTGYFKKAGPADMPEEDFVANVLKKVAGNGQFTQESAKKYAKTRDLADLQQTQGKATNRVQEAVVDLRTNKVLTGAQIAETPKDYIGVANTIVDPNTGNLRVTSIKPKVTPQQAADIQVRTTERKQNVKEAIIDREQFEDVLEGSRNSAGLVKDIKNILVQVPPGIIGASKLQIAKYLSRVGVESKEAELIGRYDAALAETSRLAKALGNVGVLTEQDIIRVKELLARPGQSLSERKGSFMQAQNIFNRAIVNNAKKNEMQNYEGSLIDFGFGNRNFNSLEEAKAADLATGSRVIIKGRRAVIY